MSTTSNIITFEQRDQLRDIFIPLELSGDATYRMSEALMQHAYGYAGKPEARSLFNPQDGQLTRWLIDLFDKSKAATESDDDFRIAFDDGYFRACRVYEQNGWTLALRRIPKKVPQLSELKLNSIWQRLAMDPELLNGGLIIICATNGQGKTTTCSSIVSSRLHLFGGHAVCIEDPPEMPLSGWHGTGHCMQIPVGGPGAPNGDATFSNRLRQALRLFPAVQGGTILMVGEVRDGDTAAEVLKAASNGHLVITTFHGYQIPSALQRFETMASDKLGPANGAELLASTLRGVFFQSLQFEENKSGWDAGQLTGDVLWSPKRKAAAHAPSFVEKTLKERNWDTIQKLVVAQNKKIGDYKPDVQIEVLKAALVSDKLF